MEIILLEKINKLGDPGDLVIVKPGYARNFLIPTGKAIRANEENKAEYEQRKASLEKAETERKSTALELAEKLKSLKITIPVPVSEEGTLYGSIGTREISDAINSHGLEVEKGTIRLPEGTLKELGEYQLDVELHPEVIEEISITISAEE
jgi:large subunit ribosomal protein L9